MFAKKKDLNDEKKRRLTGNWLLLKVSFGSERESEFTLQWHLRRINSISQQIIIKIIYNRIKMQLSLRNNNSILYIVITVCFVVNKIFVHLL